MTTMTREKKKSRIKNKLKDCAYPIVVIFRSSKHIYGQLVDKKGNIVCSCSSLNVNFRDRTCTMNKSLNEDNSLKDLKDPKSYNKEGAFLVGLFFGRIIKDFVPKVVFNRSGYKYSGRVSEFVKAIRQNVEV